MLEDAKAIATIHVHAWQVAYQGIVPSELLGSLSVEQREATWRQNIERGASETWVAEEGGEVLDWISAARSRDSDALPTTGEVWGIYVAPARWRQGVGQRLWCQAEGHLSACGFWEITLWVLKEDGHAIAFYESNDLAIDPEVKRRSRRAGLNCLKSDSANESMLRQGLATVCERAPVLHSPHRRELDGISCRFAGSQIPSAS